MQIYFQGNQSSEEAAESLLSILTLFKDRYGIDNFREINLNLTLLNGEGEDVELVDSGTSEVLGVFEVYKATELDELQYIAVEDSDRPKLQLVVDNTKPK